MDKDSLTNFIVSMNRQFRRRQFPFEKSLKLRFHNAAGCCLSNFKTLWDLEGISSRIFGVIDEIRAIFVHEPVRPTNRSSERSVLVGGQLNSPNQEECYAVNGSPHPE